MTYKYKITPKVQVLALLAVCLDIFLLPLIIMSVWNKVVVDVLNVNNIAYFQALALKFGYSALTNDWFSSQTIMYKKDDRFDDCANMISTRFNTVVDEIKKRYQGNVYV